MDAHALLWWLGEDDKLSATARSTIQTAESPLVGAGTLIEIAVKRSVGKLPVDEDWPEQTQMNGFGMLSISWSHIARLETLPYLRVSGRQHRDPFDRLLAAQALVEGIPVVSRDPAFAEYGVATVW